MSISLKAKKSLYCSTICKAWCCKHLIMGVTSTDKDIDQFLKLRGIEYDSIKCVATIPIKCSWLTNHNKCKLYSWRPTSCRAYECDTLKKMVIDS